MKSLEDIKKVCKYIYEKEEKYTSRILTETGARKDCFGLFSHGYDRDARRITDVVMLAIFGRSMCPSRQFHGKKK